MRRIAITIIGLLLLYGCENALIKDERTTDPKAVFEDLWQTLDAKYAFFAYKHIHWDELHEEYRERMATVHSQEGTFRVLSDLLYELRDGHVNLYSPFGIAANDSWCTQHTENFRPKVVAHYYLGKAALPKKGIAHRWIGDGIAYLYVPSFDDPLEEIEQVIDEYKDSKGIVLDVRDNLGGFISSAQKLCNRFAKTRHLAIKEFYKKGPGHDDFTEAKLIYTQPWGKFYYEKPIVLLTNCGCYSAASYFCVLMKTLKNVTVIGDTTGGGSGIPMDYILLNGWKLNFPASYSTDADGFNFEYGVPPDKVLELDRGEAQTDSYIEYARRFILDHQQT